MAQNTLLVDKYEVKKIIARMIGEEYIIPTLGVWESYEQIDFDLLPEKFVLKTTHDSHGVLICKDKEKLEHQKVKPFFDAQLKRNYYYPTREWPYKDVKPRIIAEKYMIDEVESENLSDYKIHCFNGIPKFILVCRNRFSEHGLTDDFFTPNWEHLDVRRPTHPNSDITIPKPSNLTEMLELAEKLSKGIPFVRVDLYTVNGHIYFGEMTFFPASGFSPFVPSSWDRIFGEWVILPCR